MDMNEFSMGLNGAQETVREIMQQPDCWGEIDDLVRACDASIVAMIQRIAADPKAQITLCGAGTSAYVGEILRDTLQQWSVAQVRDVATTEIVSQPDIYFNAHSEGLLVSFARSGSSAESLDVAEKVAQIAPNVVQLNITCNPNSPMAQSTQANTYCCLMPERTHDRSFVMTSSFSTMLLFTVQLFARALGQPQVSLAPVMDAARGLIQTLWGHPSVAALAHNDRLVYLGSNTLYGAARESALKTLEMTAGRVVTMVESALGFRHGPKSIANANTGVCVFISGMPYTQQFDCDIVNELLRDATVANVVVVSTSAVAQRLQASERLSVIELPAVLDETPDVLRSVLCVLVGQMVGLKLSRVHGVGADNPGPSGEVNRVVKGVTRYPFDGQRDAHILWTRAK